MHVVQQIFLTLSDIICTLGWLAGRQETNRESHYIFSEAKRPDFIATNNI